MFKRVLLTTAFIGALAVGGLGLTNQAEAHGRCHHHGYDYGYREAYYAPYPPSYHRYDARRARYGYYGGRWGYATRPVRPGFRLSIGF